MFSVSDLYMYSSDPDADGDDSNSVMELDKEEEEDDEKPTLYHLPIALRPPAPAEVGSVSFPFFASLGLGLYSPLAKEEEFAWSRFSRGGRKKRLQSVIETVILDGENDENDEEVSLADLESVTWKHTGFREELKAKVADITEAKNPEDTFSAGKDEAAVKIRELNVHVIKIEDNSGDEMYDKFYPEFVTPHFSLVQVKAEPDSRPRTSSFSLLAAAPAPVKTKVSDNDRKNKKTVNERENLLDKQVAGSGSSSVFNQMIQSTWKTNNQPVLIIPPESMDGRLRLIKRGKRRWEKTDKENKKVEPTFPKFCVWGGTRTRSRSSSLFMGASANEQELIPVKPGGSRSRI